MHEGERERKEQKGQSEVAGMQAKQERYSSTLLHGFNVWVVYIQGQEPGFIYMY